MTDHPLDPDIAEIAARLDAQRPRPSHGLRRRVQGVLSAGMRQRTLRRQAVWLVVSGAALLTIAAALAISAPI